MRGGALGVLYHPLGVNVVQAMSHLIILLGCGGGEDELPKKQTQSDVAEALRCAGRGHTWRDCIIKAIGELDYSSAYICLREPGKSEDKAEWSKGVRKRRRVQNGSDTQKQSANQKGGGLRGVSQCRRDGPTDREEKDAYARQRIVGLWAGSAMVPQR
ncbi:hypothetical protein BHE74_00010460 [Ensete ventricosum]|nr:hypothetical protein GW17_00045527 [Ensete ventricosum]RWW81162.1 hypothetical protein BHE74_00010460 [Ensete ventricosum]RZR88661.1 hypothetical protein BHM03_00016300 [Ensete ventricosum]